MLVDKLRESLNNSGLTDEELRTYVMEVVHIPDERILNPDNDKNQNLNHRKCDAWFAYLDKERHKLVIECYYPGSMVYYSGYDKKL